MPNDSKTYILDDQAIPQRAGAGETDALDFTLMSKTSRKTFRNSDYNKLKKEVHYERIPIYSCHRT